MDPIDRGRFVRALATSAVLGIVIYWGVIHVALPGLSTHLSPTQVEYLRELFRTHPARVFAAILVVAAVLALPVFVAFRAVYGPFSRSGRSRARF